MNISNNYQSSNPNFKHIRITENGQKALKSNPYYYHLIEYSETVNKRLPNTKYWDLEIDGEKTFDKYREEFILTPIFRYISKVTNEVFENLSIHPPSSNRFDFHVCSSKNHKYLPPEVLLFISNDLITAAENVKELAFDIKTQDEAEKYWDRFVQSNSQCNDDIYVYEALEEINDKYESSLQIGIDEFLGRNPQFKEEMKQLAREDNSVWIDNSFNI